MARIRSIRPEMWESEKLGALSIFARFTFVGLISLADDEGRGRGAVEYLRMRLHPYAKDVTPESFKAALAELESAGLVVFYQHDGNHYCALPGWQSNQKIDRPTKSRLPAPTQKAAPSLPFAEASTNPREDSSGEGKGREGKGMEGVRHPDEPQTKDPAAFGPSDLLDLWNKSADKAFPRVLKMTEGRRRKAAARIAEHDSPGWWVLVLNGMNSSPFLKGDSGRGWRASFDWLVRSDDSAVKVLEGAYAGRTSARGGLAAPREGKYSA